jgi:hypothetical protein
MTDGTDLVKAFVDLPNHWNTGDVHSLRRSVARSVQRLAGNH